MLIKVTILGNKCVDKVICSICYKTVVNNDSMSSTIKKKYVDTVNLRWRCVNVEVKLPLQTPRRYYTGQWRNSSIHS